MLLPFLLFGCGKHLNCDNIDKGKINEEKIATERELRNDYHLTVDDRFTYSCFFYNGNDIHDYIEHTLNGEDFKFKLTADFPYVIQNKDVFMAVFIDGRGVLPEPAAVKIKKIIIKKDITTCDSVHRILVDGIGGNMDKLTRETKKVTEVKLFDETINGNVIDYIKSLSPAERNRMDSCTRNFFILDIAKDSNQYGYAVNEYELRDGIKNFLDVIVQTILFKMKGKDWQHQQFILKIDGYADKQQWPEKARKTIEKPLMGIDTIGIKSIYNCNCTPGKYVDYDAPDVSLPVLSTITSNCTLSTARAFTAAVYLRQQLAGHHINADVLYRGANESSDEGNFARQRKIAVFMQLKAVTSASAPIQRQIAPATKD